MDFYSNVACSLKNVKFSITGSYCPEGSSQPLGCPPGQYQNNLGQWTCETCPAGYYCVNSTDPEPEPCPPHHYCPAGSNAPTQCPDGTVNNETNRAAVNECLPCPSGKYCRYKHHVSWWLAFQCCDMGSVNWFHSLEVDCSAMITQQQTEATHSSY